MILLLQESPRRSIVGVLVFLRSSIVSEGTSRAGCAFKRDRIGGVLRASQRAFIESVVSLYGVGAVSDLPAS